MMKPLNIIFMGTPDFSVPALETLHTDGHNIVAVYTQPPRPKGRGYEVTPSPVHVYAQKHGIPVFHPKSLKNAQEQKIFSALKADVAVVAAYGLLLPKAVLDAPVYGCINIHASLLPRWRGASPLQQAIWKGDRQTGITLMQMDAGLDTGPIITRRAVTIHPHTTAESLHDEMSALGAVMIGECMKRLAQDGHLESEPQIEEQASYAPLLKKEDGKIDWNQTAIEIDRQVRALNPWPGVWTMINGKRVKVLETGIGDASSEATGTILNKNGAVQCSSGSVITMRTLQPEGKKPMDFPGFINGGYAAPGDRFE